VLFSLILQAMMVQTLNPRRLEINYEIRQQHESLLTDFGKPSLRPQSVDENVFLVVTCDEMEIKIETGEELNLLLEALKTEIINANSYHRLFAGCSNPDLLMNGSFSNRKFLVSYAKCAPNCTPDKPVQGFRLAAAPRRCGQ